MTWEGSRSAASEVKLVMAKRDDNKAQDSVADQCEVQMTASIRIC